MFIQVQSAHSGRLIWNTLGIILSSIRSMHDNCTIARFLPFGMNPPEYLVTASRSLQAFQLQLDRERPDFLLQSMPLDDIFEFQSMP